MKKLLATCFLEHSAVTISVENHGWTRHYLKKLVE